MTTSTIPTPLSNINPNYIVRLWGKNESNESIDIIAAMPEEFSIECSSEWQSILGGYAEKLGNGLVNNRGELISDIGKMAGYSFANSLMTQQVWNTTSPIEMRIPMRLNSVYDTQTDVTIPVFTLLSLTLPSEATDVGGDFNSLIPLKAPGPTLSPLNNNYHINLSIGRLLVFDNVIVTGVSATFTALPDNDGGFIACDLDVSIRTSRILTKSGLRSLFRGITLGQNNRRSNPIQ